jgi:hypothetical protein
LPSSSCLAVETVVAKPEETPFDLEIARLITEIGF